MIYITLICAGGLSTSIMVNKMKDAAKKKNIEVEINAMASTTFASYKKPTDVLLLGPQINYLYDEIVREYGAKGIKISVINMMDYGMMNGEKVLDTALQLLDKSE
ncbi:PTS sugar transporter subunit IIB [Lacrimispora defluvii]|uniref:PTS sugar transporter subunit IIB n=1 Tax=Lacrimispora defluvii TaxID=2719233 RepID=A0ABX1VL34_9FIRM|nr:PTS sugar transporter subunit IIB [Lacrimispora defluvii]NNJ28429.1 PTS sugar transporter subunit IIB [Lacrimispora defluvii]